MNIKYICLFTISLVIINSCFGLDFEASDDTFIWGVGDDQKATNYGSLERFSLTTVAAAGGSHSRGLVKFDVSSLQGGDLVQGATLKLTQKDDNTSYHNVFLHESLHAWNESTVTWNSFCDDDVAGPTAGVDYAPAFVSYYGFSLPTTQGGPADGDVHSITIPSEIVNGWISDPSSNKGLYIAIEVIGETQTAGWVSFWSEEDFGGRGPVLELSFILKECGATGTVYNNADLNHDCYIDFADFAILAGEWLECTDPADGSGECTGWYF